MHAPTMLTLLLLTFPVANQDREAAPQEEHEGPQPIYLRSTYPERLTVKSILPPGSRVEKGQVVIEFATNPFSDRLADQVIATERARADYEAAQRAYDIALINIKEYAEGIFPQELKSIEGEIKLALSEKARAEDRLEWSNRMLERGQISPNQNLSDKFELQRTEFNLQQAEEKKNILLSYTREKQLKSLHGDVEKARADMLAKESSFRLSQEKEAKYQQSAGDGDKVLAPADGIIQYNPERISPYAIVREGGLLFIFHPDEPIDVDEAHKAALPADTTTP